MIREITEADITGKLGELSVPSRLGVKTSLAPITALLDQLGHPENAFPSIHVGGTSGKGSTATFLANILIAAGYKVGLFTKPHLSSVRERFVINEAPISPEAMLSLLDRMPVFLDKKPTWFELMTALAFQYFADEHVDFGVIEVGLGGMLDATNVILPEVSILTNVGLDHTDILGDTVEKIAADKIGIFKPGRTVVSGVSQLSVVELVKGRCAVLGAPLKLAGRDFCYSDLRMTETGSHFSFESADCDSALTLSVSMPGEHQVANAAAAAAAAFSLRKSGYIIPISAIRSGLAKTCVPGRMEVIQSSPVILMDGAHSPPKMEALSAGLRAFYGNKNQVVGVLAFSLGHSAADSLTSLSPLLDTIVLTEFNVETDYGNKRAQDVHTLAQIVAQQNPSARVYLQPDPLQAVDLARSLAGADDLICITGSIFLVGQVRDYLTVAAN